MTTLRNFVVLEGPHIVLREVHKRAAHRRELDMTVREDQQAPGVQRGLYIQESPCYLEVRRTHLAQQGSNWRNALYGSRRPAYIPLCPLT